jgi:hypothetical protein
VDYDLGAESRLILKTDLREDTPYTASSCGMTHRLLSASYSGEPVGELVRKHGVSFTSGTYQQRFITTLSRCAYTAIEMFQCCATCTMVCSHNVGVVGTLQFIMNMVSFRPSFQWFRLKNGRCAHTTLSVIVYLL